MSKRSDSLYLKDIRDAIRAIESYLDGVSYDAFIQNRMMYSATIRELEIIGEAVSQLSAPLKSEHPSIPWREIKDFRNVLAHAYFGIVSEIVSDIVQIKIPALKAQLALIHS